MIKVHKYQHLDTFEIHDKCIKFVQLSWNKSTQSTWKILYLEPTLADQKDEALINLEKKIRTSPWLTIPS